MKYTTFYLCAKEEGFEKNVSIILDQLKDIPDVMSITFYTAIVSDEYMTRYRDLKAEVYRRGRLQHVIITLVGMPICSEETMIAEVSRNLEMDTEFVLKQKNGIQYLLFENKSEKGLWIEGVYAPSLKNKGVLVEANFKKMNDILISENFTKEDIFRQWNYIGNIVGKTDGNQNYQIFNDCRSAYYEHVAWTNGYPAATGIGMDLSGVLISLIAIQTKNKTCNRMVDNDLQIPAHNYSSGLLKGYNNAPTTPKFERARLLQTENATMCFISGTAAILGESSLGDDQIERQTKLTEKNIDHLLEKSTEMKDSTHNGNKIDLDYIRIYLKNKADYQRVHALIKEHWGDIPAVYLQTDVCRDELLIEIEGIGTDF